MIEQLTQHIFPGSNTCHGFVGYFDEIFNVENYNRLFILKGGPGTGKSSLMKRVGEYVAGMGYSSVYCHCSSDPNSLDGVIIPKLSIAVLDGTSPHIVDPCLPVCADEIINMADGLNTQLLREARTKIYKLQTLMKTRFAAAHDMAAVADSIKNTIHEGYVVRTEHVLGEFLTLCDFLLSESGGNPGTLKNIYLSALTPDGIVEYFDDAKKDRIWHVKTPWGFDLTQMFLSVSAYAAMSGFNVRLCHDPINAKRINHIIIELAYSQNIFVTASREFEHIAQKHIDISPYINEAAEIGALADGFYNAVSFAANLLNQARIIHSEIEQYYIAAMDFSYCDVAFERIKIEIDAG